MPAGVSFLSVSRPGRQVLPISPNQANRRRRSYRAGTAPGSALPNQAGDEYGDNTASTGQRSPRGGRKTSLFSCPHIVRGLFRTSPFQYLRALASGVLRQHFRRVCVHQHFGLGVLRANGLLDRDAVLMGLAEAHFAGQLQVQLDEPARTGNTRA